MNKGSAPSNYPKKALDLRRDDEVPNGRMRERGRRWGTWEIDQRRKRNPRINHLKKTAKMESDLEAFGRKGFRSSRKEESSTILSLGSCVSWLVKTLVCVRHTFCKEEELFKKVLFGMNFQKLHFAHKKHLGMHFEKAF